MQPQSHRAKPLVSLNCASHIQHGGAALKPFEHHRWQNGFVRLVCRFCLNVAETLEDREILIDLGKSKKSKTNDFELHEGNYITGEGNSSLAANISTQVRTLGRKH